MATADHLIEHANGGQVTKDNIVAACLRCNSNRCSGPKGFRNLPIHAQLKLTIHLGVDILLMDMLT